MDLEHELRVAIAAAREAGDEVLRMRQAGLRYGRKDGHELVSEADLHAAEILHARLTAAFPGDGWLSEEHDDTTERLGRERVWVVDPIDGTREYLMGLPEYAVSVGLVVGGRAALGVVYNPASGELFEADASGATEQADEPVPSAFRVLVGRGELDRRRSLPLPAGGSQEGEGSVAYRLALVAAGRGDAVITNYGRSEWDVAAGAALALAAGLRVTDVLGDAIPFNQPEPWVRGLLVAKAALHRRIRTHLLLLA